MLSRRRSTILIAIVVAVVVVAAVFVASRLPIAPASGGNNPTTTPNPTPSACPRSVGLCIERNVTRVIDGDTLDVDGSLRIRLVLVNAPELNATGGPGSPGYLALLCSGARVLLDEDALHIAHDPIGR